MPEIQRGSHTVRSHGAKVARSHMLDWIILVVLGAIQLGLYLMEPFHRLVREDTMTDLKYPLKDATIPFWTVPSFAVLLPIVIILVYYYIRRDVYDLHDAILGLLFSVFITGFLTDALKAGVGRPRPDFFWRCFPNGIGVFDPITKNVMCTGKKKVIKEGYKSFPSGHTSWSFAGLTFLALYLSGKVRVFDHKGPVAKLCIVFAPLLIAAMVGVSLVDDYWHHWQDVFVGGLLGVIVSPFCYLHFFPPPYDTNGWGPHAYFQMLADSGNAQPLNTNANNLNVQQTELESIQIHHPEVVEASQSSSGDTNPTLNGGRIH